MSTGATQYIRDYRKAQRAEHEREATLGLGYARAYPALMLYVRDAMLETRQRFLPTKYPRGGRLSEQDFKRVIDPCDRACLLYGCTPRPRPTFPTLPPPVTVEEWAA